MSEAKDYGVVEGVLGNEGEAVGNLAVAAILSSSETYPKQARIIVGSTADSECDCGQFALGVTQARALIAKLEAACADVIAACPSAANEDDHEPAALNETRAAEEFAVWISSRGWFVSAEPDENGMVRVADRLSGAKRFATEDEANAALAAADDGYHEYPELWTSLRAIVEALAAADKRHAEDRAQVDVLKQEIRELEHQREAAQVAARAMIAQVEHLAAFADDNDPRVMATAGPLGVAQADLWLALGMSLDEESARMRADIDSRCAVCGWPLAESVEDGCVRGNCSMRPRPDKLYAPERAAKEAAGV